MVNVSANVGFLWADLPLVERIERAGASGFEAVECHFPYDDDPTMIAGALVQHGLRMVGLNTPLGANGADDFGVAARSGREVEARAVIEQAVDYARVVRASYVSVVAGKIERSAEAEQTFRANLTHACKAAEPHGITIVIEPLSPQAVPGYYLSTVEQAIETIDAIRSTGVANLAMMFDCFHVQISQGDLQGRLRRCAPYLGHVQIASIPDRHEPDSGEIDYRSVAALLDELSYAGWVGAEYHPRTTVEAGLGWMEMMTR